MVISQYLVDCKSDLELVSLLNKKKRNKELNTSYSDLYAVF
jgi:hypothetical protein